MSRIGIMPVIVRKGTEVTCTPASVTVKGPKGTLTVTIPYGITVKQNDDTIIVGRTNESKRTRSSHGTIRALLENAMHGVTEGWKKVLELSGVGYRASLSGSNLVLSVGFSHQVTMQPPDGITFAVVEGKIIVTGIDKHAVGQAAANIHAIKKPEPYKGKGIKYEGEHIRKKAGKSAKAVGGTK